MFSQPKSFLIPNVSIHPNFCFLTLYFKNDWQFSFLIENHFESDKRYVEYNINLGEPPLFKELTASDGGSNIQLIEKLHNFDSFKNRIAELQNAGYTFTFVSEENKAAIDLWINKSNASIQGFCLTNEVYDDIRRQAKKLNITCYEPPKQNNCLVM